jgi:hypothetical protein
MHKTMVRSIALGCAAVLAQSFAVRAADIELSELPAPVQKTIETRFAGIKMSGAAKEVTPEGQTVYEVSLDNSGKNIDTSLTPEGQLLLIEREITRKQLPEPVQKRLNDEFAKQRYRFVEECITVEGDKETLAYYEVLLMNTDKQMRAVQLAPDGTVMSVEKKTDEAEEE